MEFKILFKILKNAISEGRDVPTFFRDLIAMITDVPEEKWGTGQDPSNRDLLDETYRSYSKRKLPKKFAQSIVYSLSKEQFVESFNESSKSARQMVVNDLIPYDATISVDNVAERVAAYLEKSIQISAGAVPLNEQEQISFEEQSANLKREYGDYLYQEADFHCQLPGCGKLLFVETLHRIKRVYEVSIIDKTKPATIDNLIAMCPACQAFYHLDNNKKLTKEIVAAKKVLTIHNQNARLLDSMELEKGITGVVTRVSNLKQKDLVNASLDPKEIKEKLDPMVDVAIYGLVNHYVTTYYIRIKEIMMNLDKRGVIDYPEIQDQMKAFYRKLKKTNKSKMEIFYEISDKVHHVSLQEPIYCQAVVAYFIQSCEVFDVITK